MRFSGCVLVCLACGGGSSQTDGGIDAAGEAELPTVTLSGVVTNLDNTPVASATVSVEELASTFTTTDSNGEFALNLPTGTPLTVTITASGEVKTVEQQVLLHSDVTGATFLMATQAQYDFISTFGATSGTTGNFFLQVTAGTGCNIVGAHLSVSPASGTLVYAGSDELPNATFTSIQPAAPGGYLVGASGTITPAITDVASCAALPWPVDRGSFTVLGPIIVEPGAFHDVSIFVE